MPLKFRCPDCKAKIKVSEQFAGQLGVCPTCRKRTRIPEASDPEFAAEMAGKAGSAVAMTEEGTASPPESKSSSVQASDESEAPKTAVAGKKESAKAEAVNEGKVDAPEDAGAENAPAKDAPAFIRFKCPNCDKSTGFPSHMAGKPAACPLCRIQLMVPEENGGESFVVGAAPPESKRRAVAERSPARAGSAVAATPVPAGPVQPSKPPWLLIGAGGAVLLIVGLLIGVLAGGRGNGDPGEQQAAAAAPTPPALPDAQAEPPGAQAAPETPPAPPPTQTTSKTQEPVTPYLPPVVDPREPKPEEKVTDPAADTQKAPSIPETETAVEKTEPAPPDPMALIPSTLPRPRAKESDEEETGPGETATDTIRDLLPDANKTAATAPAEPAEPQTIDPVPKPPTCTRCLGVGYLPVPGIRPYIHVFGERSPDPASMVPWIFCSQCMKDRDSKELLGLEGERLERTIENNKKWDTLLAPLKVKLIHVETRHVLLHCELPETMARQVAAMLDKLTAMLQSRSRSVMLTQTRPDTHEIVILASSATYNGLISLLEKASPGDEWGMMRKSTGFSLGKTAVFNAVSGNGPPQPEPMAIHQMSKMLIGTACGGKSPPWLSQGFASHCENQLTRRNLCYTFAYELNDVKFGENWNQDIRKFALQGKLKRWDYIFPIDLIGLKALDYLTCYSMVNFFMGDATRFVKMVSEIRDGASSAQAVEKAYARPVKDLQVMWANWAVQQR